MSNEPTESRPRWGDVQTALKRYGGSRADLNKKAAAYPLLFRKDGPKRVRVDLELLDQILEDLPPAR